MEAGSGKRDWSDTALFGRQLKCKLTNAVESRNLETPVIGLVTEDLKWGNLLIPANTEVHGVATGERVQDRIGCDTHWVLVLYEPRRHSRRELKLQAIALDQDVAPVANPAPRTTLIDTFATWHGDLERLQALLRDCEDAECRSGLCAALGRVDPTTLAPDVRHLELLAITPQLLPAFDPPVAP